MDNKCLPIILAIIGGIILLAIGCSAGIIIQTQKTASQFDKAARVIESVHSKVIPSIIAVGEVTDISGRTVTLTREEDSLAVFIKEDAEITVLVFYSNGEGSPVQEEIEFSDIKVGNNVNISLRVLPEEGLQGISVVVFSSPNI